VQLPRIYRIFVLLAVIGAMTPSAFAQQAATAPKTGKVIEIKVPAPALKGNLLGDPAEQDATVYLPPSYETSPTRRYASVYLLHGFTGNNHAWTSGGYQGMSLQPLMDQMIQKGVIPEVIVVAPNGSNAYKGAFYTNSVVNGNWEDYIYRDLVQNIDSKYRTIARPESRGIAGHSMGGYGAISLAMKHPEVFSVVYALSPCCLGLEGDFGSENPAWLSTLRLTSKEQLKDKPGSFEEFFQIAFVAVSAAFSPNPQRAPFFVDFPYQERDGKVEKNENVFALWRAKMPLYMVEDNKQNLLKLRGIFIDYGENEEFSHIRTTTQQFSKALSERNIPHVFEIYEKGNHGNQIRQRIETRLLQFFAEKLDFGTK
jgi:S-formylglutathione hydrolase